MPVLRLNDDEIRNIVTGAVNAVADVDPAAPMGTETKGRIRRELLLKLRAKYSAVEKKHKSIDGGRGKITLPAEDGKCIKLEIDLPNSRTTVTRLNEMAKDVTIHAPQFGIETIGDSKEEKPRLYNLDEILSLMEKDGLAFTPAKGMVMTVLDDFLADERDASDKALYEGEKFIVTEVKKGAVIVTSGDLEIKKGRWDKLGVEVGDHGYKDAKKEMEKQAADEKKKAAN